jgi:hypothetical protein
MKVLLVVNIKKYIKYLNMIKSFMNLPQELSTNNVQNVNIGFKNHKDVIIWLADVNFNFVIHVEKTITAATVIKSNLLKEHRLH